jgi:alpha-amylase/alpha-mannosidase (GH57 family)
MQRHPLYLALVLHMHQPRYNLSGPTHESEMARDVFSQTLHPYTYPSEVLKKEENAKATLNFTGSLIEQINELASVGFDSRLNGLWDRYKETLALGRSEFTGCGYFHPIFPLIPEADRLKQIEQHLSLFEQTFGRRPEGFWLPELSFSPKVIPALAKNGIKWAIVDGIHVVNANKDQNIHQILYKPHFAEYDGHRIVVIPRDRMMSIAQQSGYDPMWLKHEIDRGIEGNNDGEFLLTVATDGENGWFRHFGENAGFWGWFFEPLLRLMREDPEFQFIKLTTISEYLAEHPPKDTVRVEDGSWNVPDAPDDGRFLKWTGGEERQKTWKHILETSASVRQVEEEISGRKVSCPREAQDDLSQAWRWLLMAEASDNFWWGNKEWLDHSDFCCAKAKEKIDDVSRLGGVTQVSKSRRRIL